MNNPQKTEIPYYSDGTYYGHDIDGRLISRGSQTGRSSDTSSPPTEKVHLRRMEMSSCGAYDKGGAYWGIGEPMYCAWHSLGVSYFRALNRKEAKRIVSKTWLSCRFFK